LFRFQRIIASNSQWVDRLYIEDNHIGFVGFDREGLYLNLKRDLTIQEINLLLSQLLNSNPQLLSEKIEFKKID
jgi:hypothetical protein